jgi:hypothetical protein
VSALTKTFIGERPLPEDPGKTGKVDVDDAALALVKYDNGPQRFELTSVE